MSFQSKTDSLPTDVTAASVGRSRKAFSKSAMASMALAALLLAASLFTFTRYFRPSSPSSGSALPFYWTYTTHSDLCPGVARYSWSHTGYIGLKDDSVAEQRRSFFWLFRAQARNWRKAPVILTIGGGPGVSGMLNPLKGESHCVITEDGRAIPNTNAWSRRFNVLALDFPVGVGFSYGDPSGWKNDSRSAALDVYDFLQKFYKLFPLEKNELILSSGSYGGTYLPHIATVIREKNSALAGGNEQQGAVHINLKLLMLSNPYTDAYSHYRWLLQQRCHHPHRNLYDDETCKEMYQRLPECLKKIRHAYQDLSSRDNRVAAFRECDYLEGGFTQGIMTDNVGEMCDVTKQDDSPEDCYRQSRWVNNFLDGEDVKRKLGVNVRRSFIRNNGDVNGAFERSGDLVQPAHLLYKPLLDAGIRVLHYAGELDANCGWPGILSFLKLIPSRFQTDFRRARDVPWPGKNATVRVVGNGAGDMTYIQVGRAGHTVVMDRTDLVKEIVEHWIENKPFLESLDAA